MERIGFYIFLLLVIALVGLFVKAAVVQAWNAGKLDATTSASIDEILEDFYSDLSAIVMRFYQNKIALVSSLICFVAVTLLTPVSMFSAAGYSAVTYLVLGVALPRVKQFLSFSRTKSHQET